MGSHADIQAAKLEDVRNFFKLYYAPTTPAWRLSATLIWPRPNNGLRNILAR